MLKFDCFGRGDGHFHVRPNYGERIFFDETTAKDQIERTARELRENAQFYLNKQGEERIKNIEIDPEKMAKALAPAEEKMLHFLQTIPELEEIR